MTTKPPATLAGLRDQLSSLDRLAVDIARALASIDDRQRVILRILRLPRRARVRRQVRKRRPKVTRI